MTLGTVGAITNNGPFSGAASIQPIGGGIYRIALSTSSTDTSTGINVFYSFNSTGSSQIDVTDSVSNSDGYVWGFQLEQSAFATSYIPTTGAAATRAADVLSTTIPSGVSQLIYTFDDGSTQTVSVSAGAYTVPTNLNRARIKRIRSNV